MCASYMCQLYVLVRGKLPAICTSERQAAICMY